MKGRELTASERQENRDAARLRVKDLAGTPETQRVINPRWPQDNQQCSTNHQVSKRFAQAMLEVFEANTRFMNQEHIDSQYDLIEEVLKTGQVDPELQAVFNWTVKDRPDLNPHSETS